jgi:hypothetical protein
MVSKYLNATKLSAQFALIKTPHFLLSHEQGGVNANANAFISPFNTQTMHIKSF